MILYYDAVSDDSQDAWRHGTLPCHQELLFPGYLAILCKTGRFSALFSLLQPSVAGFSSMLSGLLPGKPVWLGHKNDDGCDPDRREMKRNTERSDKMILADKIIELRKKNGWSQEELAEKLDVSRQSVSKWEGAQSVPDMSRILKLSEVFGVSTDYLLKDEIEIDTPFTRGEYAEAADAEQTGLPFRPVSLEEATSFMNYKEWSSKRISLGVMLCIFSPVLLMILGALQEYHVIGLSESQASGFGCLVLFVFIGIAVALFVTCGIRGSRYEYMEKEALDTAYGVDSVFRDRKERYHASYAARMTIGIVLCVCSVIPLFVSMILYNGNETDSTALELACSLSVGLLLVIVAIGVRLIVSVSIIWGGFQMILEEGDYTREKKALNRRMDPISGIYWAAVTAGYLAWSFISMDWHRTWIVWPIAGVAYALVTAVIGATKKK